MPVDNWKHGFLNAGVVKLLFRHVCFHSSDQIASMNMFIRLAGCPPGGNPDSDPVVAQIICNKQ